MVVHMSNNLLSRKNFRRKCLERDNNKCVVIFCENKADEVHHLTERSLWEEEEGNGGYYMNNGASVCNKHHKMAENNYIPPQAFWRWLNVEPITPKGYGWNINKWGKKFEKPSQNRRNIKYPSTGHLPLSPEWDGSREDFKDVDIFEDIPLIITIKMDGGNAMLTTEKREGGLYPVVTARNAKHANHQSFDYLKSMYSELFYNVPTNIQIFGEWLYAKHSIHYGCDCNPPCEDIGPPLKAYFQVFGVFDKDYNVWLSWPKVEEWAERLGFPTVPVIDEKVISNDGKFYEYINRTGKSIIEKGHEGLVIRSKYPFHFSQFEALVAKYVREGHVDPDAEHWKKRKITENNLK